MKLSWIGILAILIACSATSVAQQIEISPAQKTLTKYDDYEVVGRNSIGTIVHYYSKGNHKLQLFNSKMRPFNEVDLDFDERKYNIEKVLLSPDHILIFYTQDENNHEYLKLKRINYRLNVNSRDGVILDSVRTGIGSDYEGYYVKKSQGENYFVAFTFQEKNDRMIVRYMIMNEQLEIVKRGETWTEDKENMTLESIKVNDHGDLLVAIGHQSHRMGSDDNFALDRYTVYYIESGATSADPVIIEDENYLFKDLLTNWDEANRHAILVGNYQLNKEDEDIGLFYTSVSGNGETLMPYTKIAFEETDFEGRSGYYRKWEANAELLISKRIIPRSDGGFIVLKEGEHHDYQLLANGTIPNTAGYPYYPDYTNYYDENYYYDITAISINPDGSQDWKINLPKIQETENDRGRYSSFMYNGFDNVAKLIFIDDIYGNGSLTEFDFNPKGQWNKRVLLNSYREDLLLVPAKGERLSANEIIIPSEKRSRLRLVKITY